MREEQKIHIVVVVAQRLQGSADTPVGYTLAAVVDCNAAVVAAGRVHLLQEEKKLDMHLVQCSAAAAVVVAAVSPHIDWGCWQ